MKKATMKTIVANLKYKMFRIYRNILRVVILNKYSIA